MHLEGVKGQSYCSIGCNCFGFQHTTIAIMAILTNASMVVSQERGDLQRSLQLPTGSVYTALKGRHGSNSVGHFVWATHVFLIHFAHGWCLTIQTNTPAVLSPKGRDHFGAPILLAGTSACIQKRSRLVPTASVLSFGVNHVFWSILSHTCTAG